MALLKHRLTAKRELSPDRCRANKGSKHRGADGGKEVPRGRVVTPGLGEGGEGGARPKTLVNNVCTHACMHMHARLQNYNAIDTE